MIIAGFASSSMSSRAAMAVGHVRMHVVAFLYRPISLMGVVRSTSVSLSAGGRCFMSMFARRKTSPRRSLVTLALAGWGFGSDDVEDGDVEPANSRQQVLLNFVQDVQPNVMENFTETAPLQVVEAYRQTIASMLGTLPPAFFTVTVTTQGEHLAQLMFSVLMTGYMLRNAQYRLELSRNLGEISAAEAENNELVGVGSIDSCGSIDADEDALVISSVSTPPARYAPGLQKVNISGDVLRWNYDSGAERTPALQYIEELEAELASLREQIAAQGQQMDTFGSRGGTGNAVLDYLRDLNAEQLADLTNGACDEVLEAMNNFINRLMTTSEGDWKGRSSDVDLMELARLLYWLMVVGYELRGLEVRLDMARSWDCETNNPIPRKAFKLGGPLDGYGPWDGPSLLGPGR